jgi:hypothetical protein
VYPKGIDLIILLMKTNNSYKIYKATPATIIGKKTSSATLLAANIALIKALNIAKIPSIKNI